MTGPAAVIVAGPTASGKSGVAVALAERLRGTVINADSMQIYRELPILTARPRGEILERAPHRLYGLLTASDPCSAGRWRELALAEIDAARELGRLPIICGGTGLYLEALTRGLASIPPIPAAIRMAARALYERLGGEGFHAALAARDPLTASHLRPSDRQRLSRAWEVLEATGRGLAAWQEPAAAASPAGARVSAILLLPPREALYRASDRRLEGMIAAGAIEELRDFLARGPDPHWPLMKAVGLRELARHVTGEIPLGEALALAQQSTRRYIKRQFTWFRGRPVADRVLTIEENPSAQLSERFLEEIFSFIRQID